MFATVLLVCVVACAIWWPLIFWAFKKRTLGHFRSWPLQICLWIMVTGVLYTGIFGLYITAVTAIPLGIFMVEIVTSPTGFIAQLTYGLSAVFFPILLVCASIPQRGLRIFAPSIASLFVIGAILPVGEYLSMRQMCSAAANHDVQKIYRHTFSDSMFTPSHRNNDQHASLFTGRDTLFWSYWKSDFVPRQFAVSRQANFDCNTQLSIPS